MMRRIGLLLMVATIIGLVSCKEDTTYTDGKYKAETEDFHYGWKAFIETQIEADGLSSVTFDYTDSTGNLKSATTDEEYPMTPHPREWCAEIESQLMSVDILNYAGIDGVTGATGGSSDADALFKLILDAAVKGDNSTQILPTDS